jgi:hypothetical protein
LLIGHKSQSAYLDSVLVASVSIASRFIWKHI